MKKLAFVGCAHIHTPGFLRRIGERAGFEVKCVWDPDQGRSQKRANELGCEIAADPDAIWADPEIESVVICSETDRHLELVKAAAAAGKNMFVEKPLGMGSADAYEMASVIDEAGVVFQTGYFNRGFPFHRFLRDHIKKGSFGTVTRLRHANFHAGSLRDIFTPEWLWMTDPKVSGIGGFGDLGTHSLDIMMWLLGEVASVTATIKSVTGAYNGVDETGEALLRFDSGVIGSLAGGWVDVANPDKLVLSGTEGHAYVVNGELFVKCDNIEGADGEKPWTDLPDEWPHAFELYLDALEGKEGVSLVTPSEAAARSAVMEAMYKSAAEDRWVEPERKRIKS